MGVRIKDQATDTALATGDYVIVDSESEGTRKYDLGSLESRVKDLESAEESGLTNQEKSLILTLFSKAAYAEADAKSTYDTLEGLWRVVYRTITYNLTNCISSSSVTSVENGKPYSTSLSAQSGFTITTAAVTMGGTDVTASYYNNGSISIPQVTGDVVITASASKALASITATYTQSGTVYDTASLDDLKSDLVVTANYSDSTSETVTGYTLSGTLTAGTSTVTVSYGGKTATFNVTVTHYVAPPIYQLTVSDRYTYSSNDNIIGASAGNRLIHTTGSNSRLAYIMLDGVMRAGRQSLVYWLPVQAGDTYTFKLKNITYEGNTDASNKFASAFKDESDVSIIVISSIAIPSTGDGTVADQEITGTISADANLILYSWVYRAVKISYDIELYINDVRYV